MMKLYLWVIAGLTLLLVTFGIILPWTISAKDDFLVSMGLLFIVSILLPLGVWYIPKGIAKEYRNMKGSTLDEKISNSYGIDPDWPNSVQPGPPRKRGSTSKPVGE